MKSLGRRCISTSAQEWQKTDRYSEQLVDSSELLYIHAFYGQPVSYLRYLHKDYYVHTMARPCCTRCDLNCSEENREHKDEWDSFVVMWGDDAGMDEGHNQASYGRYGLFRLGEA